MMECVVAFLLISSLGKESSNFNRLVLVADTNGESIYKVFKFPQGQFPKPAANVDMPEVKVRGDGTYGTVYCSTNFRSGDIVKNLSNGLTDLTSQPYDAADIAQSEDCYTEISNQLKKSHSKQLFWSKAKMHSCSPKKIASLAYRGQILVTGKYSDCFPDNSKKRVVYQINFDKTLLLSDLVHNREIFIGTDKLHKGLALAWYQNNLHLFRRDSFRRWVLVTDTRDKTPNGAIIHWFMFGLHPVLHHNNGKPKVELGLPTVDGKLQPTTATGSLKGYSN